MPRSNIINDPVAGFDYETGTFNKRDHARAVVARLRGHGYQADVERSGPSYGAEHRVLVQSKDDPRLLGYWWPRTPKAWPKNEENITWLVGNGGM